MKKPNFVLIYCDDLGYGDLGCFGSEAMKTPHLDELARNGVRFTNWYSNSPVCSPSRAALLTGRYPARTGVTHILGGKRGTPGLSENEVTVAKMLQRQGYSTAIFGKWHLGTTIGHGPAAHGFDEFFGFTAGCVDYYSHIFYWGQGRGVNPVHDLWHNGKEVWNNGRYLTDLITEKAVAFIEKHQDDPFFLYVPYNAPHYPMHAPCEYLDRFPDLPPDRRIMAAMIAAMDDGVGKLVQTLRDTGIYEDTVIFFSSDNGPSSESRNYLDGTEDPYYGGSAGIFKGHKGSLFEGGIRMPAILSYPRRMEGGKTCDGLFVMTDVCPTFVAMAGVGLPPDRIIDGVNIWPNVAEGMAGPDRPIYWECDGQLAVRRGKWKLILNGKLDFVTSAEDRLFLANLEQDPGERINLKDLHPEIAENLQNELANWAAETISPTEKQ